LLRLHAIRVFRDQTSLSLTPELWPSIERALRASRYFLLLASPRAAASPWVQKEVQSWLEHNGNAQRLLIGLTEGQIQWDTERNDFDWEKTDALPDLLRGRFQYEPLYSDLSGLNTEEHLSLQHAVFADQVASIASTIRGLSKDELFGTEVREHRKQKLFVWTFIVVLSALLVIALFYWYQSEQGRKAALAGKLAAQSNLIRNEQPNAPELAVLLAVEAQRRSPSAEGYQALKLGSDLFPDHVADLAESSRPLSGQFSATGDWMAAGFMSGDARVWDARNWRNEVTRVNHAAPVLAVAFDRDAKQLATAGKDGRACVWALPAGVRRACVFHAAPLISVDFGASGDRLLTASGDRIRQKTDDFCARMWDIQTARELAKFCHEKSVTAAFFLESGARVITGSKDGTLRIWDARAGRELHRLAGSEDVESMVLGRNRQLVAIATLTRITVWNTITLEKVLDTPSPLTVSLALREANLESFLLAGNADGTVRIWDLKSKFEKSLKLPFNAIKVSAHPERDHFAAATDQGVVTSWDGLRLPSLSAQIPTDDPTTVTVLEFDPTGNYLVAGTEYGKLRVWRGWKQDRYTRIEHGEQMNGFFFQPTGKRVATFGATKVSLWDYGGNAPRQIQAFAHPANVNAAVISPDGQWLATASASSKPDSKVTGDKRVRVWDIASGVLRAEIPLSGDPRSLSFGMYGRWLAVGTSDGDVLVWEVPSGAPVVRLDRACKNVSQLAFSPDDQYLGVLCSEMRGSSIRLWTRGRWNERPKIIGAGVFSFAFHSDGKLVAGATMNAATIWRIGDEKVLHELPGRDVFTIALSPDGKTIAALGSEPSTGKTVSHLQFWELPSGRGLFQFTNVQLIQDLGFSTDGKVVGLQDSGGLALFGWESERLVSLACSLLTRSSLTTAEWQRFLPGEEYRSTCPN
jgi:WD40 repeat protein